MAYKFPKIIAAVASSLVLAGPGLAGLSVTFDEGAPKDRFTFQNTSACDIAPAVVTLDLSGSSAGLVFDVTGQGAGIEVFQPLEMVSGEGNLKAVPEVRDGDQSITFDVAALAPGQSFAFTIDVDDTVSSRGITVSGSEIEGARVVLASAGREAIAEFSTKAVAVLVSEACS